MISYSRIPPCKYTYLREQLVITINPGVISQNLLLYYWFILSSMKVNKLRMFFLKQSDHYSLNCLSLYGDFSPTPADHNY